MNLKFSGRALAYLSHFKAESDIRYYLNGVYVAPMPPEPEPLFHIMKGDAYFAPNYCGYRSNPIDAGKYTKAELKPYASQIASGTLRAIPVAS